MKNRTAYLPGFSHHLSGRAKQENALRLRVQSNALDGLAALVERFVPANIFEQAMGRERVFTPWVTFIAFLGQVLSRGSVCREAVRRVQVWRLARKLPVPSENSSAYCQARARLPVESLRAAHEQIGQWIERHTQERWHWCERSVKVLDGCGISMPDTEENRAQWPYAGGAEAGLRFPHCPDGRLVLFGHGSIDPVCDRLMESSRDSFSSPADWLDRSGRRGPHGPRILRMGPDGSAPTQGGGRSDAGASSAQTSGTNDGLGKAAT